MNDAAVRLGFWSAVVATLATVGYDVVQVAQMVGYPKPPLDSILIYATALLIPVPFLLAILSLHYTVPENKRIWTHAALLFSVMYATYVILNYVVQLATVIPSGLHGSLEQIRILDQTPHSLFWDVDALGYIFLGLATLFGAPAFVREGPGSWARGFFLANAIMTPVISVVYFYPVFSIGLLIVGSPWAVTAAGSMLCLALYLRRPPEPTES